MLAHTGAGPHDLFLHWRATALAAMGHVVFIADFFGDAAGDKWDSAAWEATKHTRVDLESAATAALEQLRSHPLVDKTRLVVMGYCYGGLPIFELLRQAPNGLRGVISFHGVLPTCSSGPLLASESRVITPAKPNPSSI